MKAIILAAGKGERLKEITKKIPKPMLRIKREIILEHNLKWLKSFGIEEIYINVHHLPDVIRKYFKDGKKWGIKINYSYEENILGTAGGVRKIIEDFRQHKWNKEFLVIYGDNFYPESYNLNKFINFHLEQNGFTTIGVYRKKDEILKSGVVTINGDNLIDNFVEKPTVLNCNSNTLEKGLINTGLYRLNKKVINYIPNGFSDFGRDIFPTFVQEKIPMYAYIFNKPLITIDSIELYKKQQPNK